MLASYDNYLFVMQVHKTMSLREWSPYSMRARSTVSSIFQSERLQNQEAGKDECIQYKLGGGGGLFGNKTRQLN